MVAGLLLGATSLLRGRGSLDIRPEARSFRELLIAAAIVVIFGSALAIGRLDSVDEQAPEELITLVSWNLHYGVDSDGNVDLEEIARTIEAQGASVVTLQEVSRGWVQGGGSDMATWLADRLGMRAVFAAAADRQFGNAILTNLPSGNPTTLELPYGEGPQNRAAISVDLLLPGQSVRITSVHLQNRRAHTATRLVQLDAMFDAEGENPRVIIAGDFNARPASDEILLMSEQGYVAAQDVAADVPAFTSSTTNPRQRIDWVFGRGVSFEDARVLGDARASDHLPLVVTFSASG